MFKDKDAEKLINAIKLAHNNSDLDKEIQEIFIIAIERLKKEEASNYVSYRLVNSLSNYFMVHVKEKQNKYVKDVYNLASDIQISYRKYLWHP